MNETNAGKRQKAIKKRQHVTMFDIAKAAGISKSAVSKALNDKNDVSQALKDRVFKICEEKGYQINFRIQELSREPTTHLGIGCYVSGF